MWSLSSPLSPLSLLHTTSNWKYEFPAKAHLLVIGESRRNVDHDGGTVGNSNEPLGSGLILSDDGFGVIGPVFGNVVAGYIL